MNTLLFQILWYNIPQLYHYSWHKVTIFRSTSEKTLLAVLAHPDDETFGVGGTLALYAHQDVNTHLVCATHGEAGDMDAKYLVGHNSVAARREYELKCAAEYLGLTSVNFLDYRDSGMEGSPDNKHPKALMAAPFEKIVYNIVYYIRKIKPQVIITFDPLGGYMHPDHIAIHKATVEAFHSAGNARKFPDCLQPFQPQKLYFNTIPYRLIKTGVFLLRLLGNNPSRFGKNGDIDLQAISEVKFPTHAVINYKSVAKLRGYASACHASQGGDRMNRRIEGFLQLFIGCRETFMRAYPQPEAKYVERDLFYGLS